VIGGQLIAKTKLRDPLQPLASVAWIVTLLLISAVGVPLTTPVLAFIVNPVGNVPELTANV
jgi:hypothetical protein